MLSGSHGRVVKATDQKSVGIFPRMFKSCRLDKFEMTQKFLFNVCFLPVVNVINVMDFHCAEHVQNFRIVFELTFVAHHDKMRIVAHHEEDDNFRVGFLHIFSMYNSTFSSLCVYALRGNQL